MSFLNKLGIGAGTSRDVSRPIATVGSSGRPRTPVAPPGAAVGATRPPDTSGTTRVSNGLKELLWNLDGLGRGTLLDLGSAWQTTLSFFIERGFRVTSEDILRAWKDFLDKEEVSLRDGGKTLDPAFDITPAGRAARFLESNLQYQAASFDAVERWRHGFDRAEHRACLAAVCKPRSQNELDCAGSVASLDRNNGPEATAVAVKVGVILGGRVGLQ